MTVYDSIGTTYSATRRADPRIAAQIETALGGMGSVVNVGAGTGSYEPRGTIVAIEPSAVMVAQRPPGSAPVVRALAESLPIGEDSADAVMALLTVHHWSDVQAGIAELRRAARHRVVILTWDQAVFRRFWLIADYLPEAAPMDDARATSIERLVELLGGAQVVPVPVPHDCTDGFGAAYWRRPHAYLDKAVRSQISLFAQQPDALVATGLAKLRDDLRSGRWAEDQPDLLDAEVFDAGYRLIISRG